MKTHLICLLAVVSLICLSASAQVREEWVARYNGPANGNDGAASLVLDGNGNVYVTGFSQGAGTDTDYVTIKYSAAGLQLWEARYNGPANLADWATSLAVDDNGNVYVTGISWGTTTYYDYATVKYNSAGVQQWVARYDGPAHGNDQANSLAVDGDGNAYVTGSIFMGGNDYNYATIKYDYAGAQQWVALYDIGGNAHDVATAIAVDGDGNVYVTGCSEAPFTGTNYATVKYNPLGVQQWVARYSYQGQDLATAIAVDGNGNVYVTGSSFGAYPPPPTCDDYATVKYNASGIQQWVARYSSAARVEDWAYSLAVDADGNVYVTGCSGNDYATLKYSMAGQQLWLARYHGLGHGNAARSLAVDSSGNVYVAGDSRESSFNNDYATVKYDAAGAQLWEARYNGPGNCDDACCHLAIDGNGNVFVTGRSAETETYPYNYDIATIKYSQSPPPLDVTLTPFNPSIVIPANGGSFQFNASAERTQAPQAAFYVWARDLFPDGTYYTPNLLGPVQINPSVGLTLTRLRTQNVPSSWPAGLHNYIGYANPSVSYPTIDADTIAWTKSASADDGPWLTEASCTGEPFPDEALSPQPSAFSLVTVTPNPFNPRTDIRYKIQDARFVSLKVYDTAGRLVATLVDGWREAGRHEVTFNGTKLATGVYLYSLQAGGEKIIGKMLLLK